MNQNNIKNQSPSQQDAKTAETISLADVRTLSAEFAKIQRRQALFHRGMSAAAALVAAALAEKEQTP